MCVDICYIVIKLFGACPDVAFPIPVDFHLATKINNQRITPNIKLPALVQIRVNIFLHKGSLPNFQQFRYLLSDFLPSRSDRDTIATICIFSRFDKPKVVICYIFIQGETILVDLVSLGHEVEYI